MRLVAWVVYRLNAWFGGRRYFEQDGKLYIQEGNNPPEELLEHLRTRHSKEYEGT